ncbi:hypothetical protein DRN52_04960 [Thermococci archaeon]|nr:MAG: hypothetical protein DRN52_04960 [Thermococci archaeon]
MRLKRGKPKNGSNQKIIESTSTNGLINPSTLLRSNQKIIEREMAIRKWARENNYTIEAIKR